MNEFISINELKGVGDATAVKLNKLGIYTLWDLVSYYPKSYEKVEGLSDTSMCSTYFSEDKPIALKLQIKTSPSLKHVRKLKILSLIAGDENGNIEITWFNMPYLKNSLKSGQTYVFIGKLKRNSASFSLSHPKIIKENDYIKSIGKVLPEYSLIKGVGNEMFKKLIKQSLTILSPVEDYLAFDLNKGGYFYGKKLLSSTEALTKIHFPDSDDDVILARERLVFDEFFFFIMNVRLLKEDSFRKENSHKMIETAYCTRIIEKLPYKLTDAQIRTYKEIVGDLTSDYCMNRLVQGDVGSGKTIIAFLSLICAAVNGYQGALMAPTEVLARQHMEGLTKLLKNNGLEHIKCVLLTGSVSAKEKRQAKQELKDKAAMIAVGTHALIQDDVEFADLGLVITDEQHRFGVKQREKLTLSSNPHVLVMSATPIPRTLAIIIYGDLDISLIDELPSNRLPIKNCVVGPNFRAKSYQFIEKELNEGHQALVVCPMVEDSESLDAENVVDYTERLKEALPACYRIEYLHGKMKPLVKNEIMDEFARGNIHVLVSTTVIEVGINVPNTTVMMVENAERFGLSQLHQLRGRVGRGSSQSYCIFMCKSESKNALERLDILNKSNDGFKIAEEDLRQRGPGDMFGFRQSGDLNFRLGDILTDAKTLKTASEYANYLFDNSYDDTFSEYEGLYKKLSIYSHNINERINL